MIAGARRLQRPAVLLAFAIVAMALVRAGVAAAMPLSEDEAYYRLWGLAPALSYLDHPPMAGWMIAAGLAVAGGNALGVRLGAVLTSLAGPFVLWRTAHILFGAEVARRAVWIALAMPLLAVGGVLMTPDTPSVLFWGLAGWALAELYVSGRANWWLAVGLFAGLGLLSKYTNLFVGAGIVLWILLLPANRHWLRSWQLWAGGALAACLTLPVVIWNAEHRWASFAKQFGRVAASEGLTATYLLELIGAHLALASPIVAVLGIIGLWKVAARAVTERDPASALLAASILPFLAYLLQHALHDRVQPNWAAPLYPALAVCAALAVAHAPSRHVRQRTAVWARWGVATGFLLSALLYAHALSPLALLPPAKDPTAQLRGWAAFASQVDDLRAANGACWIATSSYGTTGQLAWALRGRAPVLQLDEPLRYVHLPPPDRSVLDCPALYVELERRASEDMLTREFRSVTTLGRITRDDRGAPVAVYRVYRLADPAGALHRR
jgi:4-amino-4-deoxy-L-arabinose transferase-like glycosyltransferase